MIKLNINMAYCDFLKEEPGSENNRTDRKFIYAALFNGLKKIYLERVLYTSHSQLLPSKEAILRQQKSVGLVQLGQHWAFFT